MPTEQEVRTHLQKIAYPGSRHDIVSLGLVSDVGLYGNDVAVHFRPSSASDPVFHNLSGKIVAAISALPGVGQVVVHDGRRRLGGGQQKTVAAPAKSPLPGIGNVIAVAS